MIEGKQQHCITCGGKLDRHDGIGFVYVHSVDDCLRNLGEENRQMRRELAIRGIVLPGWTCGNCYAFNGEAKEQTTECRVCGGKKP